MLLLGFRSESSLTIGSMQAGRSKAKSWRARVLGCAALAGALSGGACGTNTDEPIFPLFLAFSPLGAPSLVNVAPVEVNNLGEPLRYEFDVQYFITNQEEGFLGYNLYIDSSATSAEAALGGVTGDPYLPQGVEPSFVHADDPADTSTLISRRVEFFRPPPGLEFFQVCELYFFRITAYTRTTLESNPSVQLSACAAANPELCPVGSPCNIN